MLRFCVVTMLGAVCTAGSLEQDHFWSTVVIHCRQLVGRSQVRVAARVSKLCMETPSRKKQHCKWLQLNTMLVAGWI